MQEAATPGCVRNRRAPGTFLRFLLDCLCQDRFRSAAVTILDGVATAENFFIGVGSLTTLALRADLRKRGTMFLQRKVSVWQADRELSGTRESLPSSLPNRGLIFHSRKNQGSLSQ